MMQSTTIQLPPTRLFLVDAPTTAAVKIRDTMMELPGVIHVESPIPYHEDPLYCQLAILAGTEVTDKELDDMMWSRNVEYVGVIEMTRQ
ncbi:hypothetical protein [Comamonas thiooxydans]|uniref:hypothetical protein n=1 Tax=Comamonas thiooxydans TaxID=363952 RepID=UPI000A3E9A9B|nr:hypothetical protein [Comamonas thiooxydans]